MKVGQKGFAARNTRFFRVSRWVFSSGSLILLLSFMGQPSLAERTEEPKDPKHNLSSENSGTAKTNQCSQALGAAKGLETAPVLESHLNRGPESSPNTETDKDSKSNDNSEKKSKWSAEGYEKRLWKDLRYLYDFLLLTGMSPTENDFLITQSLPHLLDMLYLNHRLPSQLALQLKAMEKKGLTPQEPQVIVRALVKLTSLMRGKHLSLSSRQCTIQDCKPMLTKEMIFGLDGKEKPIWFFEYFVKVRLWNRNLILWEKRELEIDQDSLSVRAQNPAGVAYMESLLKDAQRGFESGRPWTYIFIDLNNLGLVNSFKDGNESGDRYIISFSEVVRRNLSATDHFLRVGGDEFLIFAENRNAADTQVLVQKIMDELYEDQNANSLFEEEWAYLEKGIGTLSKIKDYPTLSKSPYAKLLQTSWLEEAESDFGLFSKKFKARYKKQLLKKLEWQRFLMKPTFSVGTRLVQPGDSLNSLKAMTSCQGGECKRIYKEEQGANASKGGGSSTNRKRIDQNIEQGIVVKPRILPTL